MKLIENGSIYAVLWQDAAFSLEDTIPESVPPQSLTIGFIIEKNSTFVHIGTSVKKLYGDFVPEEGLLIPSRAIIEIREIGSYGEK